MANKIVIFSVLFFFSALNCVAGDDAVSESKRYTMNNTAAGFPNVTTIPGPVDTTNLGVCGNGIADSGEECDDGNVEDNDGCSSVCKLERGWQCTGAASVSDVSPVASVCRKTNLKRCNKNGICQKIITTPQIYDNHATVAGDANSQSYGEKPFYDGNPSVGGYIDQGLP
uniref:Predicted protein n=1 Tax=Hordeum vulgare subsp. vulgare TaxID=112509 RepID=F2E6U4_HORVV|nr:predicted protein [Hordeum vulgare subsp. vulgare]